MQSRTLYNGIKLPMIGYGTFRIRESGQCERCVAQALETGYRLFDTAASYENEAAIGRAHKPPGRGQTKDNFPKRRSFQWHSPVFPGGWGSW